MNSIYTIYFITLLSCVPCFQGFGQNQNSSQWSIEPKDSTIILKAGILQRNIELKKAGLTSKFISISGHNLLAKPIEEITFTVQRAFPNAEPQGMDYTDESGIEQADAIKNQTDALSVKKNGFSSLQNVQWIDPLSVSETTFANVFTQSGYKVTKEKSGTQRLILTFSSEKVFRGLSLETNYEICEGYPVIRKWVKFSNNGDQWLKISDLKLEQLNLNNDFSYSTLLTPNTRGLDASIIAFSDSTASTGIISVSEIPAKLRRLSVDGVSGYNPEFFEWVLGPGETFQSEPLFLYAFSGKSYPTISSVSTALDRCVEDGLHKFLVEKILLAGKNPREITPLFCSWTNYSSSINDSNMCSAAEVASRIGFRCFQLDAGWSEAGPNGGWAVSTPQPKPAAFPEMGKLSDYFGSKGLKTGLWYSVFLNEQLAEKKGAEPVLFSLPVIRRAGGLGLSFCYSKSREKYVNEILHLNKTYHASYLKQDLSNICYGDIARGHESRSLKESYLRGLRGLFETQDEIHREAPDLWLQLSHEIYWETPGPAADVAVLKHVDSYHAAPNEYWGAGNRSKLVSSNWKYNVDSLKEKLILGAFRARNLLYAHRGLPLNRIEVFGAVTTNFKESLTPEIQDRQICSWLLGAPLSFSGDLGSLTGANIEQYRSRFAMLRNLEEKYNIYSHFQYSGVPPPTDEGWHWWGKLNAGGCGVVVVLRGSSGSGSQKINIPWVKEDKQYRLKGLFKGEELGDFSGKQLQEGDLKIDLVKYGQELIEIAIVVSP